jgi:hypothetical protein
MRHVTAVLSYEGKQYVIERDWDESGGTHEDDGIYYQWTDGNYGCDCNRALFIEREYGESPIEGQEDFPWFPCGDRITLVSLTIDDQTWDMEEERKKDEEFMARGLYTMSVRYPDLYKEVMEKMR